LKSDKFTNNRIAKNNTNAVQPRTKLSFQLKMYEILSTIFFCCISIALTSQVITGNLNLLKNTEIKLEGFNGLKNYTISSIKTDSVGNFKLSYSANDIGVGYLIASDDKPFFVILSGEDIEIAGEALSYTESIQITKGKENQLFEQYSK